MFFKTVLACKWLHDFQASETIDLKQKTGEWADFDPIVVQGQVVLGLEDIHHNVKYCFLWSRPYSTQKHHPQLQD